MEKKKNAPSKNGRGGGGKDLADHFGKNKENFAGVKNDKCP